MYALAKTKPRVWLKLSWIHQKLVQLCQNPLKYVTICCSHFGLILANRNPYFGRNRDFTETPNLGRYRNRNRNFLALAIPRLSMTILAGMAENAKTNSITLAALNICFPFDAGHFQH